MWICRSRGSARMLVYVSEFSAALLLDYSARKISAIHNHYNKMDWKKQSEIPLSDESNVPFTSRGTENDGQRQKKSTCKRIRRYFRDYCDNSSMIGFKYLGEKRTLGERILWFFIIAVAIALSVYYILEIYWKYEENPFLVNLATRESPIYSIPFPAVTICPVVKTERDEFNFTKAVHKIWDNESLTEDELIYTQYFSLICENMDSSYKERIPQNDTFTEDFYDQLDYLKPARSSVFFLCSFMGEDIECEDIFVPILLDDGVCYTFNMLNREDIYKDDVVHYSNYLQNQNHSNWTIDNGYAKGTGRNVHPKRALLAGADSALEVILMQSREETDYLCCSDAPGYTVVLHTAHTIPQLKKHYNLVPLDTTVQFLVQPKMMTTSKEVKNYRSSDRKCYFTDERFLKYFDIYTPENCGLECLTNYTLDMCGCVNFFMPRTNSTKICGNGKASCMEKALYKMKENELNAMLSENGDLHSVCNCMPLCTELTYDTETARTAFPWREQFKVEKKISEMFEALQVNLSKIHLSRFSVYFRRDQFLTSQRTELYGPFDFLANFGGLLGLFTGFSVLSAVEIIYYLSVRWWCNRALYNDFAGL